MHDTWTGPLYHCTALQNELTGEHSCIMLKMLNQDEDEEDDAAEAGDEASDEKPKNKEDLWLHAYWKGTLAKTAQFNTVP